MKGILFKPDMIKAIVTGRKTQTRRLGGLRAINQEPDKWTITTFTNEAHCWGIIPQDFTIVKSHYQVSETVYIKEAWRTLSSLDTLVPCELDRETSPIFYESERLDNAEPYFDIGKKRSSLFMPAWAAHYFIKITDVRVERLQKISETDAELEGFKCWEYDNPNAYADCPCTNQFIQVWNFINKPPYDWKSSPWVWVYGFKLNENNRL